MTQELTGAQRYGLRLAIEGIKSRVVQERSVLQLSSDTEPIRIALAVVEAIEQHPMAILELIRPPQPDLGSVVKSEGA